MGRHGGQLGPGRFLFRGQLFWQELLPEHVATNQLEFKIGMGDDKRNFARIPSEVYASQVEPLDLDDPRLINAAQCTEYGQEDEQEGILYSHIIGLVDEISSSPNGPWDFVEEQCLDVDEEAQQWNAILIFLPGTGEIQELEGMLKEHHHADRWWVLTLHAGTPFEDQANCFSLQWPEGCICKVICATNVAETSVTIPDVTVVIDTYAPGGLVRTRLLVAAPRPCGEGTGWCLLPHCATGLDGGICGDHIS